MVKFTLYFQQRKEKRKDGKSAIRLILMIGRKQYAFATPVYCTPKNWNDEFQVVVKDPAAASLNAELQKTLSEAQRFAAQLNEIGQLTPDNFKNKSQTAKTEQDFLLWAKTILPDVSKDMQPGTIRHYKTFITKISEFQNQIYFSDIDKNFIERFEYWMKTEKGNSVNTIANGHKFLKKFLKLALIHGHLQINPYDQYKVKKQKTTRPHLTQSEVSLFLDLFKSIEPGKLKTTLRSFLFSVFTGLAYADIYSLTWEKVKDNCVIMDRQKTGAALFIPLNKFALSLMVPSDKQKNKVLGIVYSNQKTNDYLKVAAERLNIQKNISFHVARHTNAILSLKAGISLSAVQSILGHSDIKTTQIYLNHYNAEILEDSKKFDSMEF